MRLTLAAAQAAAVSGDLDANVRTAAALVREAAEQGAQVVVLPETFLTGYDLGVFAGPLPSLVDLPLDPLREAARDTGAVVVASSATGGQTASRRSPASWSSPTAPSTCPTTSSTSTARRSSTSRRATTAPRSASSGLELGLSICYDGCFPEHARAAADDGAVAYLSSSAYFVGGEHRRDLYYAARAVENGMYVVFAGLTGRCGAA